MPRYTRNIDCLVPRRGRRRAAVGLLAWVPRRARRTTRRRSVTTTAALRPAGRATGRRSVLLLLLAVLTLGRATVAPTLLTVLLLGRRNLGAALLVLGVVGRVDSAEDELEDPKIGSEVDGWVGTSHLSGLVLVVGSAVNHAADGRVVVKLSKELGGCSIVRIWSSDRDAKCNEI